MLNLDALQQLKDLKKEIHASRNLASGKVKGTTSKFGFVTLTETGKDVYLSPDEMQKVFPGDEIEVEIFNDGKKKDYAVVQKLIRSDIKVFCGEFKTKNKASFAEPDINGMNRWLFIPPNKIKGAKEGDFIKCKVTQHPIKFGKPQVEILDIIGNRNDALIEQKYTLAKYDLANSWSKKIEESLQQLPEQVNWEANKRKDFRELPFVTIDSASTQDMDDALFVESTDNGWKLHVAIADPTEFIAPGSVIEKEAMRRGTTVYYPEQVISMLPESIANKLSSLVAGEDRLALICSMTIGAFGDIEEYEIVEGVINSRAKLSYENVADHIENNVALVNGEEEVTADVSAVISKLVDVYKQLNDWRLNNALVTSNRKDFRLKLNEKGKIDHIKVIDQSIAHKIVEECMIAANQCAANFMMKQTEKGLFITHNGVRKERAEPVQKLIEQFITAQHGESSTKDPISTLEGFKTLMLLSERTTSDTPLRTVISRQLERSSLSDKAAPHFGMGLEAYTNFTSPIRKFNDFYVHRIIKNKINGAPFHALKDEEIEALQQTQINAKQATNENENWLKWQYMQNKKKQTFNATIQRSNSAGFFVKLDENGIEGFVSTKDMPDKYSFDQVLMSLKSKKRGFLLDQNLTVKVSKIDKKRHQIIFDVVEPALEEAAEETAVEKAE